MRGRRWLTGAPAAPLRKPFRRVGRNDPCPCGSGKKFKRCCIEHPAFNQYIQDKPTFVKGKV